MRSSHSWAEIHTSERFDNLSSQAHVPLRQSSSSNSQPYVPCKPRSRAGQIERTHMRAHDDACMLTVMHARS